MVLVCVVLVTRAVRGGAVPQHIPNELITAAHAPETGRFCVWRRARVHVRSRGVIVLAGDIPVNDLVLLANQRIFPAQAPANPIEDVCALAATVHCFSDRDHNPVLVFECLPIHVFAY